MDMHAHVMEVGRGSTIHLIVPPQPAEPWTPASPKHRMEAGVVISVRGKRHPKMDTLERITPVLSGSLLAQPPGDWRDAALNAALDTEACDGESEDTLLRI